MHPLLFALYLIESIIFALTAWVLYKKHSRYPDCSVGYHLESAMESEERWIFINRIAGKIGGIFAAILAVAPFLLGWLFPVELPLAILFFFVLSILAIAGALLLPPLFCKRAFPK